VQWSSQYAQLARSIGFLADRHTTTSAAARGDFGRVRVAKSHSKISAFALGRIVEIAVFVEVFDVKQRPAEAVPPLPAPVDELLMLFEPPVPAPLVGEDDLRFGLFAVVVGEMGLVTHTESR